MKCAHCQFDVSVGFAFCPGCGQKLTAAPAVPAAAPDADRRTATVLFADLSGFTAISERLDPEDVRRLQTDLFAALRSVIDRFDAYPEKFIGDAVVAILVRHRGAEDDARNRHASDVRAEIQHHAANRQLTRQHDPVIGEPRPLLLGPRRHPIDEAVDLDAARLALEALGPGVALRAIGRRGASELRLPVAR